MTAPLDALLGLLFELSPDALWVFGREDLRLRAVNQAVSRELGFSPEELLGVGIDSLRPPEDVARLREAVATMQEGFSAAGVWRLRHRNGGWRHLDIRWQTILLSGEEVVLASLRDVTDAVEKAEQLRLLEAAVAQQDDILIITAAEPLDVPGGPSIVYVNDAFVRQLGYAREEVIGRNPRFLQGPGTSRSELDRIRRALERAEPVRTELLNYTKDQREIWLELAIAPVIDTTGRVTHFVAVERDITARRSQEFEMRIRDERFRLLASASQDVIWDWDLQRDTVWYSEAWTRLTGGVCPDEDASGAAWIASVAASDRSRVAEGIAQALAADVTMWTDEYDFMAAEGRTRHVIDRGFIIRDEAGKAVRMLGSMVDLTEQRALERRLESAERIEALGQLTGGIAHDFNNLLTIILGNAELLREQLAGHPALAQMAERTAAAANRGADLTRRLLSFARRQELQPRRVDLGEVLETTRALIVPTMSADVNVDVEVEPRLWEVEIDAGQLEAALINLALNARDAMPGGGRLSLSARNVAGAAGAPAATLQAQDHVLVTVSDSGVGMSESVAARAFEPFFTTKGPGGGSGLGLSMVYGFVRQSRGQVQITSRPGEGTTFSILLPRAGPAALDAAATPNDDVGSAQGERILVVEDEPQVRALVGTLLLQLGYRVDAVADAEVALQALARHDDFALLLTDIVMPGSMNGRELAERAVALRPDLSVLYTSGYAADVLGADDRLGAMLSKPYRRDELAARVREAIDGRGLFRRGAPP